MPRSAEICPACSYPQGRQSQWVAIRRIFLATVLLLVFSSSVFVMVGYFGRKSSAEPPPAPMYTPTTWTPQQTAPQLRIKPTDAAKPKGEGEGEREKPSTANMP